MPMTCLFVGRRPFPTSFSCLATTYLFSGRKQEGGRTVLWKSSMPEPPIPILGRRRLGGCDILTEEGGEGEAGRHAASMPASAGQWACLPPGRSLASGGGGLCVLTVTEGGEFWPALCRKWWWREEKIPWGKEEYPFLVFFLLYYLGKRRRGGGRRAGACWGYAFYLFFYYSL